MNFIECTNCKESNSALNAKCKKCGSILQGRVANLNLFETMWEIIEKPKDTFKKICLSEQKNYVFLLFSIIGIGLLFTAFWYSSIGNIHTNLLNLLILGIGIGPFFGALLFFIFTYMAFNLATKIFKTEINLRNIRAVTAYAMVPAVFATIFVLPAELIVFGLYLFTDNPSPVMIKPAAFYALFALDLLSIIYSIILFFVGIYVSNNSTKVKSFLIASILLFVFLFLAVLPMEVLKLLM